MPEVAPGFGSSGSKKLYFKVNGIDLSAEIYVGTTNEDMEKLVKRYAFF